MLLLNILFYHSHFIPSDPAEIEYEDSSESITYYDGSVDPDYAEIMGGAVRAGPLFLKINFLTDRSQHFINKSKSWTILNFKDIFFIYQMV
jgi:hypothetical protein